MEQPKTYYIGNKKFLLRTPKLQENEALAKILNSIKPKMPVQFDFTKEMTGIVGSFVSELVYSRKAAGIVNIALQPRYPSWYDHKFVPVLIRKRMQERFFKKNLDDSMANEVLSDFFSEGSMRLQGLVNRLMNSLIERIALMQTSGTNTTGSDIQSRNSTVQPV